MSQPEPIVSQAPEQRLANGKSPEVLHKVCIQCNNVFRVPPEKFDAKQCPNCHKG